MKNDGRKRKMIEMHFRGNGDSVLFLRGCIVVSVFLKPQRRTPRNQSILPFVPSIFRTMHFDFYISMILPIRRKRRCILGSKSMHSRYRVRTSSIYECRIKKEKMIYNMNAGNVIKGDECRTNGTDRKIVYNKADKMER